MKRLQKLYSKEKNSSTKTSQREANKLRCGNIYFVVINDTYLFELNWHNPEEAELTLDEADEETGTYNHIDSWTNFPLMYGEFLQFCMEIVIGITFEEINSVKAEIIYNTKHL